MLMNVFKAIHLVVLTRSAKICLGDPSAAVLVASLLPLARAGFWEVQVIFSAQVMFSDSLLWVFSGRSLILFPHSFSLPCRHWWVSDGWDLPCILQLFKLCGKLQVHLPPWLLLEWPCLWRFVTLGFCHFLYVFVCVKDGTQGLALATLGHSATPLLFLNLTIHKLCQTLPPPFSQHIYCLLSCLCCNPVALDCVWCDQEKLHNVFITEGNLLSYHFQ